MKKVDVLKWKARFENFGTRNNGYKAAFVVAHAKWSKQRGRGPSLSYNGERNPAKALVLAKAYLSTYDPQCGESVENAAMIASDFAQLTGNLCHVSFNGIELMARPGTHFSSLVSFYTFECHRQSEEYRNSPRGKADALKWEMKIRRKQKKVNQLMEELPTVDFADLWQVILWLKKYWLVADFAGMKVNHQLVYGFLLAKGFRPGVNTEEQFIIDDKENNALYLIGQAMIGLQKDKLFQILVAFADDWREKFYSTSKNEQYRNVEISNLVSIIADMDASIYGLHGIAETINLLLGKNLFNENILSQCRTEDGSLNFKMLSRDLSWEVFKCKMFLFREKPKLFKFVQSEADSVKKKLSTIESLDVRKMAVFDWASRISRRYGPRPVTVGPLPSFA